MAYVYNGQNLLIQLLDSRNYRFCTDIMYTAL